ncbi:MAG: HAMP domain-containing histidine kinase [Pedobacter sp.]|nr:MAG: HAMP domain-containing histidine kinase [Pedobacter sp.]
MSLNKIAGEQEEEIRRSKIIDEQKTEFISIASHEIKTPITVIKAYAQIAKKAKDDNSQFLKEIVEKIDFQSSKLLSLVQQLLDVSKIENGSLIYSMEQVSICSFILEMASIMRHILPNHELITELCEDVDVRIDKLRMEQVFSNILGNAAKYSEKNTVIKITSILDEGFVKICVSDQGIGMSTGGMKSIFEKFYRNEDVIRTHAGLGMGLYITSKIVTDHGGKIWVTSDEGLGSRFYFTVPF